MTDLGAAALVVEDLARRRVAVAGGEPDVATADLAKLGRTSLEQGPLQLIEFLVAPELEMEIDGARRVLHLRIMTSPCHDPGTLRP
jgi:hypothetical protein